MKEEKSWQFVTQQSQLHTRGLVSKETVVLHQWGSEKQYFGFIN